MSGVAKDVVPHIRLPVLSPEELGAVEEENRKDHLLNVRGRSCCNPFFAHVFTTFVETCQC